MAANKEPTAILKLRAGAVGQYVYNPRNFLLDRLPNRVDISFIKSNYVPFFHFTYIYSLVMFYNNKKKTTKENKVLFTNKG